MMNETILFKTSDGDIVHKNGEVFNTASCSWENCIIASKSNLIEISLEDAIKHIQVSSNSFRSPVAVVGTHNPTENQYKIAEEIGESLSFVNLSVVCGGRAGIMEAVCKGVEKNKGLSIGILPESSIENANKHVTIPIATGLGFARNSIIAASSLLMIAIGNGYGTTSEVAYGLMFGKKVFSIESSIDLDEVIHCSCTFELLDSIYANLLSL